MSKHDGHFNSGTARNLGLTISISAMFVLYFMIIINEPYLLPFQEQ